MRGGIFLIPLQSIMLVSFPMIGRTSALVRAKTKSIRRCYCSTMKLSLQRPPSAIHKWPSTELPLLCWAYVAIEPHANYHGLNDLTPPPSLQMIHIISIFISIILSPPLFQIPRVLYLMYPLRSFGNNY